MVKRVLLLLTVLLFCACDADDEYTTKYQCYFSFDTNLHNTCKLLDALNPMSPGIFALVTSGIYGGVRYIDVELNDGKTTQRENITSELEIRRSYVLGAANGLIIGYSMLGNGLYAFDRQCPNCMEDYHLYKYPLKWYANGTQVKCDHCNRIYDLNNNGFIVEGEGGKSLNKFHAAYNPGKGLIVHN